MVSSKKAKADENAQISPEQRNKPDTVSQDSRIDEGNSSPKVLRIPREPEQHHPPQD
jgi:hypothetical protein